LYFKRPINEKALHTVDEYSLYMFHLCLQRQ